MAVGIKWTIEF